jgi:translation initiation factor 1 (eIF-1/SUI1)
MDPLYDNEDDNINTFVERTTDDIKLWTETTRGKKRTCILNLNIEETILKDHLKTLKKKCACNGNLKLEDINDKKHLVFSLQGEHIESVYKYFTGIGIKNIIINGK